MKQVDQVRDQDSCFQSEFCPNKKVKFGNGRLLGSDNGLCHSKVLEHPKLLGYGEPEIDRDRRSR